PPERRRRRGDDRRPASASTARSRSEASARGPTRPWRGWVHPDRAIRRTVSSGESSSRLKTGHRRGEGSASDEPQSAEAGAKRRSEPTIGHAWLMQYLVAGIASRRASAISSPQTSHFP